nr:MAG TPA: hypothetical protein [Caudoviricetes sp.]
MSSHIFHRCVSNSKTSSLNNTTISYSFIVKMYKRFFNNTCPCSS